jgi:hypothetical protein
MRYGRRRVLALAVLGALAAAGTPAGAVEYRLQVVSLHDSALLSFLRPGEVRDGAAGPGLDGLGAALDQGRVPPGAALWDRRVQPVGERVARAWGGVPVESALVPGGDGRSWDEVRWEGKAGEQTVWLVAPAGRHPQELYRTALKGAGPMRYHEPYGPAWGARPLVASRYALSFLWFHEERGTIWDRQLARSVDLGEGIAVVVGLNDNTSFPDSAYLVVRHGAEPTTFKAVLGWRQRSVERAPSPKLLMP